MKSIRIQERTIGPGFPVFVIAEAGLNHNGNPDMAAKLIKTAAACGADAIKFQTYTTAELFPPDHPDYAKFERHVFSRDTYEALIGDARRHHIVFLSTPFDEASADLLESLNVPAFKIGSGELTHLQFLKYLALKKRPLLLSTGMATGEQVDRAVETIQGTGNGSLALLHCVSAYPCPLEEANVRRITTLRNQYELPAGYSDHTESTIAAVAAVSLGACIIEKHFTLSHHLPGWDHHFSFDPDQFRAYVKKIRDTETVLGSPNKALTVSEKSIEEIARRSLYARTAIKAGEPFTPQNLIVRRPIGPLPADQYERVLGKIARRDIQEGTPIQLLDIPE